VTPRHLAQLHSDLALIYSRYPPGAHQRTDARNLHRPFPDTSACRPQLHPFHPLGGIQFTSFIPTSSKARR
jgi:hypothetical protein